MQGEVIKVHGVDHVILEQRGSIFNPKLVGRSVEDGKVHNIKLTQKGLIKHSLELVKQVLCYVGFLILFLVVLILFN